MCEVGDCLGSAGGSDLGGELGPQLGGRVFTVGEGLGDDGGGMGDGLGVIELVAECNGGGGIQFGEMPEDGIAQEGERSALGQVGE